MKFILLIIGFVIYGALSAQNVSGNKSINLKEGTFYIYPEYFISSFKLVRNGNTQKEYKTLTNDSTEWNITWVNDSLYSLRYIKGGAYGEEEKAQLKEVTGYYGITKLTKDYYVYNRYENEALKRIVMRDTVWFKQKPYTPLKEPLYTLVANKTELKELEKSKTTNFSLLYFYMPYDDSYRTVVKDFFTKGIPFGYMVTGYTFVYKMQKEGTFEFLDNVDDTRPLTLDIKFGKTYFIKASFSGLVNEPRINFKLMDETKGREEAGKVELYETAKDI